MFLVKRRGNLRLMCFVGNAYASEGERLEKNLEIRLFEGHLNLKEIKLIGGKSKLDEQQ